MLMNPCSVGVPSECGVSGARQRVPPSSEIDIAMSYEYVPPGRLTSQCATQCSSVTGTTDGKSAQLTNQPSDSATIFGSDQRWPSSMEYLTACAPPAVGSSQLMTVRPSVVEARCGDRLPGAVGESRRLTANSAPGSRLSPQPASVSAQISSVAGGATRQARLDCFISRISSVAGPPLSGFFDIFSIVSSMHGAA